MPMTNAQVMSTKDAKVRFGELMSAMQCAPVFISKNNKPVGAFVLLADLKDTYILQTLLKQSTGNDDWARKQLAAAPSAFDTGGSKVVAADDVFYDEVIRRVKQRLGAD